MRRVFLLALALGPFGSVSAQDVDLVASVDRDTIRENESFRYVLRAEGQLAGRPDLSALSVDFDPLDTWQSSSIQIINGTTAQVAEWVVELMPRQPGTFELPPVELGGMLSNPVTVEILPAEQNAGAEGDVFIEVELDRESGYVQAQALFTLRLFVGIGTGRQTLTAPRVEGGEAIVEKLGADREYQTVRGGRVYNVRERKYAIFPQAAGELTIGPAVYEAMIMPTRGFARQQRLRSDVLALEVLPAVPPPAAWSGAAWLPASRLEISESWSDGSDVFEQGVPRTRTLTVVADGLLETQLPELVLEPSAGLRQYPDQPELSRNVTSAGIEARRTERFAVIAQEAGELDLPPVELPWFDVDEGRWELARIEGTTVEVRPGADIMFESEPVTESASGPEAVEISPGWWPWLSAGLALGWLATGAAWAYAARARRPRQVVRSDVSAPSTRSLLRQLVAACRVNDPHRTRDLLLQWAGRQFSEDPPGSLGSLAARLSDPLAGEIRALEAALYGPAAAEWRGEALATHLKASQSVGRGHSSQSEDPLLPLYR
jgi:hypothetical protein